MQMSFLPVVFMFFFSGQPIDLPMDLLGLLDPEAGLSMLEKKADTDSLEQLITPDREGGSGVLRIPSKEVEGAIQNLASNSEGIRGRARKKLVSAGPAVKTRLEEVVAKDERRAAEAKKVLKILEGEAGAAAHEDDIARVLAIRLAGKKKMKNLLPAIEKAAASKSPFVRLAAEDVLVRLGEKSRPEEGASKTVAASMGLKEVEALPKETRLLVAINTGLPQPGASRHVTMSSLMKRLTASFPIPEEQLNDSTQQAMTEILKFIRTYGNMRPDRAFVANVGLIDDQGGGLGFIIQGLYQPGVLRKALSDESNSQWTSSEIAGVTVYKSRNVSVVLLSENSVLLLPDPRTASMRFPLEEYLKNFAAGKKALRESKRYSQFLTGLSGNDSVRGLAITDETLMSALHSEIANDPSTPADVAKAIKGLKEVELTVTQLKDGKSRVRFEGEFNSNEDSKAITAFLDARIKEGIAEMEQAPLPFMKSWIDMMKGIRVAAEGKKGILRLETNLGFEGLIMPFLMVGRATVQFLLRLGRE
ncbi:MAG: HEAT repeat domain-containing protein [Planctomycetota bacterium]|nr:HEAT repeat domain-containing protein [Planctomycetota bacterium]